MQTDEYGISLSRELDVCRSAIRKARRILVQMENRYNRTTEDFIASGGGLPLDGRDTDLWRDSHDALLAWEERLRQYEELSAGMRR